MKRRTLNMSALALWAQSRGWAWADKAFPSQPIRVIARYPAGGVTDLQTRLVSAGGEAAYGGTNAFTQFLASDSPMGERINRMLHK